ncbi:uncharacterized protein PRCAT00002379001 [Priceomyces carsonii]|uniref:uncharacterized protein n=1 Tax=Priceomyces carsonii TaxID=28549 RepID=UPI002ED82B1A|nr:unnamed protein product [Priceomyces carsonii]
MPPDSDKSIKADVSEAASSASSADQGHLSAVKTIVDSPTAQSTSSGQDGRSYQGQISNLNSGGKEIDLKAVGKHLVNHDEALKLQGGDITRSLYHQMENSSATPPDRRRTRSSSFSTYLSNTRRESTASDINVPGGFRREFLINKSLQQNKNPPNFLTQNFMEFLSIYGHFAGEDFTDDDENNSRYEEVFDEESHLLGNERIPSRNKKKTSKGTASTAKTYFLLFKALVGSGVLFLPRAFLNGGLLFSIVTLSTFGALTFFCYIVLIESKKTFKKPSFGELGYTSYGKILKLCILVSILLSQIGFVATYILFTAENMMSFLTGFLGFHSITAFNVVLVQCVLLIPLSLIRNLTQLSLISLVSSVFIVIGLLIIFYYSGIKLMQEGLGPHIELFNSKSWSMLIGVAVTSFEGIGLILPIESSMAHPEQFPKVLLISMLIITSLFVAIGTVGYSAFGDKVKSIIILNLPQKNVSVQLIVCLYSLAVFLTAPLQLLPAIKIGESTVFNSSLFNHGSRKKDEDGRLYKSSGKYNPHIKWLKNTSRAIVVILICSIAYLNANNIDKFVSFNGCFACIPLVYIYPPLIHLKTFKLKSSLTAKDKFFKITDYTLIIVGIAVVIYSTYQIVFLN